MNEPSDRVTLATRISQPEPAAASFRLRAVSEALAADGAAVTVLTTTPPAALRGGNRGGSRRHRGRSWGRTTELSPGGSLETRRWPVLRDKTGYVRGYLPYLSFDIPLFFRLLFLKRADVILAEPPPTTGAVTRVAAALRRTPYVWYAADLWSDATRAAGAPKLVTTVLELVEKFAVRGAAGIIAVSDGVADRIRSLGGCNVRVIPNGIDTEVYDPSVPAVDGDDLARLGITGDYLIYAGTASEWQGAEIFVQAMRHLLTTHPDLQLVYMGQGSRWEHIREEAAALNRDAGRDVVVLLPAAPPRDAARLLASAQAALVSIVPDQGYDYAYPTKVLAALAAGTPVLYAGKGPVTSDLEAEQLGRAAAYNAEDIAAQLETMLEAVSEDDRPNRLHSWVKTNRSLQAMGCDAAGFIRSTGRKAKR